MSNGKNIKFSVIIPAWNAAQTIARAINSCVEQSYPPHEIIVVDDASTDNTQNIIAGFPQVTYIRLSRNAGPAHARNTGWAKATGDFIAFQDADDIWHREKLQIIAGVLAAHTEVRFMYHPYTLSPVDFTVDTKHTATISRFPFIKLLWSNPIGTPCTVLVNDAALRFDETMRYMEDYDLWMKAGHKYGTWLLDIPLTRINRPILSAGGQSSNRRKMRSGEFKAYIKLAQRHPQYWLLVPLLIGFGAIKHVIKSFGPPRSNY